MAYNFRKVPELANYLLQVRGFPNHIDEAMRISRLIRKNERPNTDYHVRRAHQVCGTHYSQPTTRWL